MGLLDAKFCDYKSASQRSQVQACHAMPLFGALFRSCGTPLSLHLSTCSASVYRSSA